jgi:Fe2+ transport system protein B
MLPQLVNALKTQIEKSKAELPRIKADADAAVARAGTNEREQLRASIEREKRGWEAAVAAAEKQGILPPYIPRSERSLTSLGEKLGTFSSAPGRQPVERMEQSITQTVKALEFKAAGDFDAATKAVTEALSLWQGNEEASRAKTLIDKEKAAMIADAKAAEARAAEEKLRAEAEAAQARAEQERQARIKRVEEMRKADEAAAKAAAAQTKPDKPSLFSLPVFWVGAFIVIVLVLTAFSLYRKFRAPENNLLDQE